MIDFSERLSFAPFVKAVAGRQDVRAVLEVAAGRLNIGAAFREAYTGRLSIVSSSDSFRESAKTFPMLELSRIYFSRNVHVGNVHSGVLFFDISAGDADSLSREDLVFIENTVIAAALCLERSFNRAVPGDEKKEKLVKELLSGRVRDYRQVEEMFDQWGWKKEQEFVVLLLRLSREKPRSTRGDGGERNEDFSERERHVFYSLARSKTFSFFPKSFCVFFTNMLVFLLPLSSGMRDALEGAKDILENICLSLKEEMPSPNEGSFFFAAGGRKSTLSDVGQSYDEAKLALALSKNLEYEHGVLFWDTLGGFQLVALLSRTEEARLFCERVLGDLVEQKDSSSGELLETLLAMDRCNWNVRAASDALRFHYNTVKYRLGVIRERIGFDSSDPAQRFDMALALRLAPFFSKVLLSIYTKKNLSDLAE